MKTHEQYLRRIETIHRELGISPDYGLLRNLAPYPEASDLDPITEAEKQFYLAPRAAIQWGEMKNAAAKDNVELLLISGFRSVDRQRELIQNKLSNGIELQTILTVLAAPGFSQHHTGLALDIGTPNHPALSEDFENTSAFRWLSSHANQFGFGMPFYRDNPHGFIYEPWHWFLQRFSPEGFTEDSLLLRSSSDGAPARLIRPRHSEAAGGTK